ncbi:MAG: DUF1223 domain-containing protein [Segetibacter sp.]|nr:DUF1223 domain-containing protein [Segetibacter sp.]
MLLVILLSAFSITTPKKTKMIEPTKEGFAVVELFTSEGCSSCPSADKAVAALPAQFPQNVFILSFHVDYWNYIGWKDVFSKPEYTQRQKKYASKLRLQSIYTPQVIVNGRHEFVGSNKAKLQSTITSELKSTDGKLIDLLAATDGKTLTVTYKAKETTSEELNIALIQKEGVTEVKRGENGGRKLYHINIVRDFKSVAVTKDGKGTVRLTIPEELSKDNFAVIAYLQQKNNGIITAAKKINLD